MLSKKLSIVFFIFFLFGFSFEAHAALDGSNILLTEVMPDAVESGVDNELEWVEIYNPTDASINIDGWEIRDGAGNNHVFDSLTENTTMGSGEYRLLIADATDTADALGGNGVTDTNGKSFEIGYPGVLSGLPVNSAYIDIVGAVRLNNTGDSIEICSGICNGSNQVDYFEWEDFSSSGLWNDDAGSGTGNSICREGIVDTDTEADWSVTACNSDPTDTANDGNPGTGSYGTYDIVLTETGGSTEISESGTTDIYSFVLSSTPKTGEIVTITITPDTQCNVDFGTISFDNTNWNVAQNISVSAVDDGGIEISPHSCVITHTTSSSDTSSPYHNFPINNLDVQITDNDVTTSHSSSKKKGGSIKFSCKDEMAMNYDRFGRHKQSLCEYDAAEEIEKPLSPKFDILAENATCPYFNKYHRIGQKGGEISLIQTFLNQYYDAGLSVDGVYGNQTALAIGKFQEKWRKEILNPWSLVRPTNRWYQSTRNKANEIAGCDEGLVTLDNGALVD